MLVHPIVNLRLQRLIWVQINWGGTKGTSSPFLLKGQWGKPQTQAQNSAPERNPNPRQQVFPPINLASKNIALFLPKPSNRSHKRVKKGGLVGLAGCCGRQSSLLSLQEAPDPADPQEIREILHQKPPFSPPCPGAGMIRRSETMGFTVPRQREHGHNELNLFTKNKTI